MGSRWIVSNRVTSHRAQSIQSIESNNLHYPSPSCINWTSSVDAGHTSSPKHRGYSSLSLAQESRNSVRCGGHHSRSLHRPVKYLLTKLASSHITLRHLENSDLSIHPKRKGLRVQWATLSQYFEICYLPSFLLSCLASPCQLQTQCIVTLPTSCSCLSILYESSQSLPLVIRRNGHLRLPPHLGLRSFLHSVSTRLVLSCPPHK